MAELTLATANKINVGTSGPNVQITTIAGEAITAGAPCFLAAATGKAMNADANSATADAVFGIATRAAAAGEAVTLLRLGIMEGWSNLPAYGAQVFVSDTVGVLADAAGTASIIVGVVIPVWGAATLAAAADKALLVSIAATPANPA